VFHGRFTDAPPHEEIHKQRKKKGKRGKRGRGKPKSAVKETSLDEIPLESYRIIEDESGLVINYLMAKHSLIKQWIELRHYVQGFGAKYHMAALTVLFPGYCLIWPLLQLSKQNQQSLLTFPGMNPTRSS